MSERVEEFVIEAREHLNVVEESLLALEKATETSNTTGQYDRCFRAVHSIKGDAGFLGLNHVHQLAHAMESLLSATPQPLSPSVIETLLAARDRLAVLIDDPRGTAAVDLSGILQRLAVGDQPSDLARFEIDLAEWNLVNVGGIAEYVLRFSVTRNVREGHIRTDPCDLSFSLPSGPIRWTGIADAASATDRADESPGCHLTEFSANLEDSNQRSGGLVAWFRDLSEGVFIEDGQIVVTDTDLRSGLPDGRVLWTGHGQTKFTPEELSDKFGVLPKDCEQSEIAPGNVRNLTAQPPAEIAVPARESAKPAASVQVAETEKSSTLRIQVELLDRLMTLVGELTLVRNQSLLAFAEEDGPQRAIIQRLNSVTSELQDTTLRARMQPVGNLFNRFPRMVRDLARQLGKQVEIELQGREVELDKTILEQLSDPLMHLIRNSVDHGIEMPEDRVAKGKSPVGHIVLSATHEDGQVHIEIRDDGKGVDPEAVKSKALLLRLRSEGELERMSPRELFSLILLPGFSTAREVTEVSGRGVGMDVVKTNIEQLEGTLTIDSVFGFGCSTVLRMPLTLAIIPCLIVKVGEDLFAVPQRDVEEVACLYPQASGRIEQAFDTEVYRLREKLLPVVRLSEILSRSEPFTAEVKAEIIAHHSLNSSVARIEYILVLKAASRRFGLVVDEVRGTQEIVVKPLHSSMKRVGIFTGSTIMGDGRVALITDSEGIVEHARLSFDSANVVPTKLSNVRDAAQAHRVLLFEYGPLEQFALPLIQVRRIELVEPDSIEQVGNHEYVTVEGVSTRILRLDKVINATSPGSATAHMCLILPKFVLHPVGILVSRIVDTESLALELQQLPDQDPGILGTAIVRGRLTLFLDMHRLAETLFGRTTAEPTGSVTNQYRSRRLLLIDDTAFFREVVKRYLVAEGHEIVTAIHGEDGLMQLKNGGDFDLIVSDIEMPVMDGWDFAREVRRRGIRTPMLALTSLSGMQYEVRAKECGYDSYEVKLDHDRLVRKVGNMLASTEVPR